MDSNDFKYKTQDVDFLGFLEAQLRDLQGIRTLVYELIQNADDVKSDDGRPQTTWISFDITDEALIVQNDGLFRPVDFERLQNISSGAKREEIGTTGAFGLGFISVFQVTDKPEIFSNGIHWIIRPDAPQHQRILEREVKSEGTLFRLPWAFNPDSIIRRTLRINAIQSGQLSDITTDFCQAIETAALFLNQLRKLEVKRNGEVIKQIEIEASRDDQIIIRGESGQSKLYFLFNDDFESEGTALRAQYVWQIEENRRNDVQLVIPAEGVERQGRLFIGLPTEASTPLPFHINADFFPTTDRKRVHFTDGYQAEWNLVALKCAAQIVAKNIDQLRQQLGHLGFWHLLQQIAYTNKLAQQSDIPVVFDLFWQTLAPNLKSKSIIYTSRGQWDIPNKVRLWDGTLKETAVSVLEALNIPIIHPDLSPFFKLMQQPEINTPDLVIKDITDALIRFGLNQPTPLHQAPPFLRDLDDLTALWDLINTQLKYLFLPEDKNPALREINQCALVLTDKGNLDHLNNIYQGNSEAKNLFPSIAWLHDIVASSDFPGRYVKKFGARQAIESLAQIPTDQLERDWRLGRLDIPGLFRWFEAQQIEIFSDDPSLQKELRRLPLCPVSGKLRPLADLFIPGGFEDPLRLTGLIDLEAVGNRPQFLRDLGVRELDFDTYVRGPMIQALKQYPDIPSDARFRLLKLLAERLGEIQNDDQLQEQLSQLPLIACMDGIFRNAAIVYASREAMTLLGERIHIAESVSNKTEKALHHWLGVREEPSLDDIVQSLLSFSQERIASDNPLDLSEYKIVHQCLLKLNLMLEKEHIPSLILEKLRGQKIIPNKKHVLTMPEHLFFDDLGEQGYQIPGLEVHILSKDEGFGPLATAIGVRKLSQTVKLHLVEPQKAVENKLVQKRIRERYSLLVRILKAEKYLAIHQIDTTFLKKLRVISVNNLQIQYQLTIDEMVFVTKPEIVDIKLDATAGILYITEDGSFVPWTGIARELASAIKQEPSIGSLALGIKEVLTAHSGLEASKILDELGYPQ